MPGTAEQSQPPACGAAKAGSITQPPTPPKCGSACVPAILLLCGRAQERGKEEPQPRSKHTPASKRTGSEPTAAMISARTCQQVCLAILIGCLGKPMLPRSAVK